MSPESFIHYKIGIPELDEQHWKIFCQASDIKLHLCSDEKVECLSLFHALRAALMVHGVFEVSHMKANSYPYIDAHVESHTKYNEQLDRVIVAFETTPYSSKYISDMFYEMFVNHVDHDDRNYAEWLQNQKSA